VKPQGFPRGVRIRTQYEYKAVFDNPHRFTADNLVALCQQNSLRHARLGVTVPKKGFKLATDRNTVKRVIRESFRKRQAQLNSLDIVILVRQPRTTFSKRELRECIERLWRKVETQFAGA
jgi:ribonuclease P protein component